MYVRGRSLHGQEKPHRFSAVVPVFLMLFLIMTPAKVLAAQAVKISTCAFTSATSLKVTAVCTPDDLDAKVCYLFAVDYGTSSISSGDTPLKSAKVSSGMTFTVNAGTAAMKKYVNRKFLIAVKEENGSYKAVSSGKYVSNPGAVADYHYKFPKAASKKGLQVSAEMLEDAAELNVQHSVLNIVISDLLVNEKEKSGANTITFSYNGKEYRIYKHLIDYYDKQLTALCKNGTVISAVLLLGYRKDLTWLIVPEARKKGHSYYAWNITDAKTRETFCAVVTYLARRYASKKAAHGRIANWILGNEIDIADTWNYCGDVTLKKYIQNYASAFRLMYNCLAGVYSKTRAYISLSHLWNTRQTGCFTARETLDAFAQAISSEGRIPWNIAYHPYSSPLTEPKFWENRNGQLTSALTSPIINMGNLSVLTSYVKKSFGSSTRIILSESGFTSKNGGKNLQKAQIAAIAYGYLIAEADDMIDAFVIHRHVDNSSETSQNLYLGLWSSSGTESARNKKKAWKVFKYMDTSLSKKYTKAALKVIGAKDWSSLIKGYNTDLYSKYQVMRGTIKKVKSYRKRASVKGNWRAYGAVSGFGKANGVVTAVHDPARNYNCQWGVAQDFSGLSFKKNPLFFTTLRVNGSKASKVFVRIRFYSGKRIFECSRTIPSERDVKLKVSLKKWKYRAKVTRIRIQVEPVKGGWNTGAAFIMNNTVRGR